MNSHIPTTCETTTLTSGSPPPRRAFRSRSRAHSHSRIAGLALAAVLGASGADATAKTITVGWDLSGGFTIGPNQTRSIGQALALSQNGDVILVYPGIYREHGLDFHGKAVVLRSSNGPSVTTIDCAQAGRAFDFHTGESAASEISGFTIANGNVVAGQEAGGAIRVLSCSPTLTQLVLTNNSAFHGGAIYLEATGTPTVSNCRFVGNKAVGDSGGGLHCGGALLTLTDCTFTGNKATYGGGGAFVEAWTSVTIARTTFEGNTATYDGGGLEILYPGATVNDCTFTGNRSGSHGGAMYSYGTALPGGSMRLWNGKVLYSLAVNRCVFKGNQTTDTSDYYQGGGAMCHYASNPVVTDCTFTDNSSLFFGGAVLNKGYDPSYPTDPLYVNCRFSANRAAIGGAVYNDSTGTNAPTFMNCTFSRNIAVEKWGAGGGALGTEWSSTTLINCTFAANHAPGPGGAIEEWNQAPGGSLKLVNCILWGDSKPELDLDPGSLHSITYSDIQGLGYPATPDPVTHNFEADPLFVAAPNAGPDGIWATADDRVGDLHPDATVTILFGTLSHPSISPVLNRGNNSAIAGLTIDLDHKPRIQSSTIDLGAYENQGIKYQ